MPSSGAVQLQWGENLLDPCLLQGWTGCQVVWEPLLLGSGHWHLLYSILDQLRATILESILPGQHRSRCYQHFGGVFILSRKPDSGWLLKQFPDPDLRCRIHGPLDPSGKIPLQTQIEHPKSNRYHALWTTHRHWSGGLVCNSPEDQPGTIIREPLRGDHPSSYWIVLEAKLRFKWSRSTTHC